MGQGVGNRLNAAEIGLEAALSVVNKFDSKAISTLSPSDQLAYALAQAAVGIGYSVLQIAKLKEQQFDESHASRR